MYNKDIYYLSVLNVIIRDREVLHFSMISQEETLHKLMSGGDTT
jgi:hypothetical protein